jgi:hypothetical protein
MAMGGGSKKIRKEDHLFGRIAIVLTGNTWEQNGFQYLYPKLVQAYVDGFPI